MAAEGVRFDFAHAHSVLTLPSHASIVTGQYPFQHGIRDNSGYRLTPNARTVATLLKQAGYATSAFVAAFPLHARFGLSTGFDRYDDLFGDENTPAEFNMSERPASEVAPLAQRWIAGTPQPWFSWVHVFDPHAPYRPAPPFDTQYAGRPYYGEVASTDAALAPLLDEVRRSPRPTLVIVTGDHGEGLGEHGEEAHGIFAYESTLRIPLIIAELGGGAVASLGEVSSVAARHVDILPTILDAIGQPVPADLPGRSLLPSSERAAGAPARVTYFEAMSGMLNHGWAPLSGVVVGREKFIDLPIAERYDLATDATETTNLAGRALERDRALAATLRGLAASLPGRRDAEDADAAARLRALGYVSAQAPVKETYTEADDPKRLVALDQLLHRAVDAMTSGRVVEAEDLYRQVIAARPDMAIAYRHIAFIEWQAGNAGSAIAVLRRAVAQGVTESRTLAQLGEYLSDTGQVAESIRLLEPLARQPAVETDTLNALGIAYARAGRSADAKRTFERLQALMPDRSAPLENLGVLALAQKDTLAAQQYFDRAMALSQFSVEDTLTWIKGAHSLSMGGSFSRTSMRNWAVTPFSGQLTFGTVSNDTAAFNMLDSVNGAANFPGGINTTYSGYAKNLYGFLTGRVTNFAGTYYLQPDGTYKLNGERRNQTTADDLGFFASDSWRVKPNLTVTLGLRWEMQLPMTTDGSYSRPQDWQMVYGITGAGDGKYGQGNLYKPGVMTGTAPVLVPYKNGDPAYKTDWNNVAPSVGFAWRPSLNESFITKILGTEPVFRGGYSITYTRLGTAFFDSNYSGNPGRSRAGARSATSGTPFLGSDGWPVLLRDTARLTPSAAPAPLVGDWTLTPAVNESIDIHYPEWPVPYTHQYSFGIQRQFGKTIGLDVRYVGNTNVGGWTSWNMNGTAQWSMLDGENGFLSEFRKAQANLRANIIAGQGNTFAYTGVAGTSPLPIFQAYFAGIPLADPRNNVPANYTSANYRSSTWYNSLNMYSPSPTGIAGTGTSGLQNGIGTGTGLDANRIKAGLPINFFMANPSVAQGSAFLETTSGNTRFNAIQVDLTKRMNKGFMVQANYQYQFGRKTWTQRSLREDWFYIDSGGGADHTLKGNFVYELPFGKGKTFGSNAGRVLDAIIGGWEVDGIGRIQTGSKFNYGGFRLVGMTEDELQDMFKFYREDINGVERIFMLPQDVIAQSIIALTSSSAVTASGYAGALPTGRYLAPASGPDCVQYLAGDCPGTALTRWIRGPKYWKVDMSIVKRVTLVKNLRMEARMDLFNVFDTINFNATAATGSALTSWQVTSAAQDVNASQDPGGRITQFGLRFTW